jgi:hypothetical protein
MADDEKAEVGVSLRQQLVMNSGETGDIFFDGEAANEAESKGSSAALPDAWLA